MNRCEHRRSALSKESGTPLDDKHSPLLVAEEKEERKEKKKKVKPGAQQKQSVEDVARALEEKKKAKAAEAKAEEERKEKKYLRNLRAHAVSAMFIPIEDTADGHDVTRDELVAHRAKFLISAGVGIDCSIFRLETLEDAAEKKLRWKAEHEAKALAEQRQQEKNRLLPKNEVMSDNRFKKLCMSVGWHSTDSDLDAVLKQLSGIELSSLWCETPLWHQARKRGLIR